MTQRILAAIGLILITSIFAFGQQAAGTPMQTLVDGSNRFGLKYLRQLQKQQPDENLLIAPANVSMAFAFLQNAADYEANREIRAVFERPNLSASDLNSATKQLLATISKPEDKDPNVAKFRVSNSLWSGGAVVFAPRIVSTAREFYGASMHPLLPTKAENQRAFDSFLLKSIGVHTSFPVPKLAPDNFALVSASRFEGKWNSEFDESLTTPREFRLRDKSRRVVDMMYKRSEFQYLDGARFQAVYLPYRWGYGMYVFLPDDDEGIDEFVNSLTPENWKQWTSSFEHFHEGVLELPKFRVSASRDSTEALKTLGLVHVFSSLDALAGILKTPAQGARLTKTLEDESIEVNEKRTVIETRFLGIGVAAGVTPNPPQPFNMLVDHPFLFAVVEDESKSILYVGIVTEPSVSKSPTAKEREVAPGPKHPPKPKSYNPPLTVFDELWKK